MKWVLVISAISYGLIKVLKYSLGIPEAIDAYATDLLCLPLVLGCSVIFLRKIFKDYSLFLSPAMILVAFVAFSIVFEWILPLKSDFYVADFWDVVMYALGGLVFYLLQKKIPTHSVSFPKASGDLSMKEKKKSLS